MPRPRKVKGFSKKAVKELNKKSNTAISKRFGKSVDIDTGGGRRIGYANVEETQLPNYNPRSRTTKTGRRSLKKVRRK